MSLHLKGDERGSESDIPAETSTEYALRLREASSPSHIGETNPFNLSNETGEGLDEGRYSPQLHAVLARPHTYNQIGHRHSEWYNPPREARVGPVRHNGLNDLADLWIKGHTFPVQQSSNE